MSQEDGLAGWEARAEEAHYKPGELAALLGYSPSHLRRLFQRAFGCSPSTRLHELRQQRLKQLVEGKAHLKEIAGPLGVRQPHYLSELFHATEGVTIRAYRRAHPQADAKAKPPIKDAALVLPSGWTTSGGKSGQTTVVIVVEVQTKAKSRDSSAKKERKL